MLLSSLLLLLLLSVLYQHSRLYNYRSIRINLLIINNCVVIITILIGN